MDKTYASAAEAVADIAVGASLDVGGFGLSGVPIVLIRALLAQGTRDLDLAAEVDELVEPGVLDPDDIHLPGIYVDRVVVLSPEESADLPIEKVTTRPRRDA